MLDRDLTLTAANLLTTAIGEMMEDALADGALQQIKDLSTWDRRATDLRQVGADITALASAMAVLARRSTDAGSEA